MANINSFLSVASLIANYETGNGLKRIAVTQFCPAIRCPLPSWKGTVFYF